MTVYELIRKLTTYDPDTEIKIECERSSIIRRPVSLTRPTVNFGRADADYITLFAVKDKPDDR